MAIVTISPFCNGQELKIYQLIRKVYDEFVAQDYSEEGNRFFYEWIQPARLKERQKEQINLYVAMVDKEIAGMIEIRNNDHISLLFVDKAFHRQGIARLLFAKSLKKCLLKDKSLDKFYVHASPYSIRAYERMGFVAADSMQENNGIKYLPKELQINSHYSV
jgi:GNAT superfamily N-acetyltransferase